MAGEEIAEIDEYVLEAELKSVQNWQSFIADDPAPPEAHEAEIDLD